MPMTFLEKQYRRLERTSYDRSHTIRIWRDEEGWKASADQAGGYAGDINGTPEEAVKAAVNHACSLDRRSRANR